MAREKGMGSLQREKSGRWTMRVGINGKRYSRSTRTTDRAKAERMLMRFLAPFGLGEHRLPLAEVWNAYVISPNRNDLAKATLASKRSVWMHFAKWMEHNHLEVGDLNGVTHEAIAEYLAFLRSELCASTYNNRVCVLREIFHVLAQKAGLEEDPWEGVRLRVDDSHSRRELTVEELRRLLAGCEALDNESKVGEWKRLFLIGIYSGLRLGDCCRLEWSAVNLNEGVIQVVPRKTKRHRNGRPVTIPIHPELRGSLEEVWNTPVAEGDVRSPFVMPTLADAYLGHKWTVTNGISEIFKKANITMSVKLEGRRKKTPEATFHSLRHTFVSLAANAGVPLHVVQSIVGHESTAMTRHYYHENVDALRAAVAAIPSLGVENRCRCRAEVKSESRDKNVESPLAGGSTMTPEMMGELKKMYEALRGVFGENGIIHM